MNARKFKTVLQVILAVALVQTALADSVREATSQGNKLYMQGNFNEAINQYDKALVEAPQTGTLPRKWRDGGYLEKRTVPKDPWGNEYIYLSPGVQGRYGLISYGADGAAGGEGLDKDINNWEFE